MPKPKTFAQQKRIFGLCKQRGLDEDTRRDAISFVTNGRTNSVAQLTYDEANALIKHLGGDPVTAKPRRTENYQKQAAGVPTMATAAHLAKMDELAERRGMSPEGLKRLCWRMIKRDRPLTAQACNAVIEALKAMNRRDSARRAA